MKSIFPKPSCRGSVLVFSLLILSILLVTSLTILSSALLDRKASLSTAGSTRSFQVADSGVEEVLYQVYKASHPTLGDLASAIAGASCSGSSVAFPSAGGTVTVTFYEDETTPYAGGCAGTDWRDQVVKIKSEGTTGSTSRAVEVAVARNSELSGYLWSMGRNSAGQLGLGNTVDRTSPTQVGSDINWDIITNGDFHGLAIRTDGTLWSWGDNSYGQLGLGDTLDRTSPTQVGGSWKTIAAYFASIGIKTDGTLWGWGENSLHQLGLGADIADKNAPTPITGDSDWESAVVGRGHSFAIKTDGTLWGWGGNLSGQLGFGDTVDRIVPTQVGGGWKSVMAGRDQSVGIKTDGTLWSWGGNSFGQLGLGDTVDRTSPTQVGSDTWEFVAVSLYASYAIKTDGTLWSWGGNSFGQLGLGDTVDRTSPTQVGSDTWEYVDGGSGGVVGVKADGTLWSWGNNSFGQLGLGDTVDRTSPTQVGSGTTWRQSECGGGFCQAVNR